MKDKKTSPTLRTPGDLFQRDVKRQIEAVNSIPILQGAHVIATFKAGVTLNVPHTLGRPYVGWIIIDRTDDANVNRDPSITSQKSLYIPLQSDIDTTLTLWVF